MRIAIYEHVCAGGLGVLPPLSLLLEGRAMLEALVADFRSLPDFEVFVLNNSISLNHSDEFDGVIVIAPEFEGILESLSHAVVQSGGNLLGCTVDAIRLAADKLALARHWQNRGVPTPVTELASAEPPLQIPPPWILKPRDGAGSQATLRIADANAWTDGWNQVSAEWPGPMIVQPLHAGIAVSVSFLAGPQGIHPLLAGRQILTADGRFQYLGGVMPLSNELPARALRLARQALETIEGIRGFAGVDLLLSDAGDVAIELNPRLTTSYLGLRALSQQNLANAWWCAVQGQPVEISFRDETARFHADGRVEFGPYNELESG